MLILTPSTTKVRAGEFDYLTELTSQHSDCIIVKHIERSNHSFVKGPGKEAVRTQIEEWLRDRFSVAEDDASFRPTTSVVVNV